MDLRKIAFLLVVSLLLFGAVTAQKTVNDFKVDESYSSAHNGTHESVYLNERQDSGVTIYNDYIDDDHDDVYDDLVHDHGRDYLTPDDDFKIDKNSDNTVTFKDYDHGQHGVAEVIKSNGTKFVVVFWAKNNGGIDDSSLISQLNEFNKDNNVKAISF